MSNPTYPLGRRIVILGATGSGKSTLARHLGASLGLRVVELDAMRHGNGWDSMPFDEMREKLAAILDESGDGWVCEGNYSRVRDVYLSRADTVIWLHLPWRTSFWRLFKRTVGRALKREVLWGSVRESWRITFFSRQSILWWSISHHSAGIALTREGLAGLSSDAVVHELRSPEEIEALMQQPASSRAG